MFSFTPGKHTRPSHSPLMVHFVQLKNPVWLFTPRTNDFAGASQINALKFTFIIIPLSINPVVTNG